jgi:glycosyltransferase involved in cell wall biosynthesis
MAAALVARGHQVHVLSCVEDQKHKDYVQQGVYIHCRCGEVPIRGFWRAQQLLKRILPIPRTIWRFEKGLGAFFEYRKLGISFDVIEYPDWAGMGFIFALLHTKPLVAHLHTPPPSPSIYRHYGFPINRDLLWAYSLVHFATRRADVITAPSRSLVATLKGMGFLRGRDVEDIPHPIDWIHWRDVQPVLGTRPIVLFLGRLEGIKAPEVLVEAISIIRRKIPEARAMFVGKSDSQREGLPYLEWMKRSAADLSGCRFVGEVPRHKLAQFLSLSRVLAMPSWFETYPMAALEAMAAGRPVVVTATTGSAELVEEIGAGRVVSPGDPKALAEALLPFLMDAAYAADVGQRARAAVEERLDPDRIAARRENVYYQAISSFKRRTSWKSLAFWIAIRHRLTRSEGQRVRGKSKAMPEVKSN